MERSAIDWLVNKMLYIDNEYDMKLITKSEYQNKRRDIIDQAKETFEQQIKDAYGTSHISMMTADQYYNETYKTE